MSNRIAAQMRLRKCGEGVRRETATQAAYWMTLLILCHHLPLTCSLYTENTPLRRAIDKDSCLNLLLSALCVT